MTKKDSLSALFFAVIFFCVFLIANSIIDMSMEGNVLAYPTFGYLIPSIFLSFTLFLITFIAKQKKKEHKLKLIGIIYFVMLMIYNVVFYPLLPLVCYQTTFFSMLARLCFVSNIAFPLRWLLFSSKHF